MDVAVVEGRARAALSDVRVVDPALALALSVMAQVQLPVESSWWLRALMLTTTGSLALRRRWPLQVVVVIASSVAVMGFSPDPPSVFGEYLAVMLAAYTVAERCGLPAASAGLAILILGIVGHDWRSPQFGGLAGFVSDSAIPVVIWVVGRAVHFQRARVHQSHELIRRLEAERQELAKAAVAAERGHLARELHDVVTHTVSLIVIQAQGARRVLDSEPDQVSDALQAIESAGRSTLTEMRRLLGLLREEASHSSAAQPGLADITHLADQVRSAGLPVTVTTTGSPSTLDPAVDLTAYRVVQEALTNSLKYARPGTACVELRWHDNELHVRVTDTGTSSSTAPVGGRGLLGMRERISMYGGGLRTGPLIDGGYEVSCRLPLTGLA